MMDALEAHLSRQAERSEVFFWNRLRWHLVTSFLPAEGEFELVDVGAGPGFLGDFLRREIPATGYRFVEPIESLERSLGDRFGVEANLRDAEDFGTAGYVTLLDVLEHQEDDDAFLGELAAKMRPGSVLLLTVPAMPSLWSQWDVDLGHYRRYTKKSLARAASDQPLRIVESSYIFPELLPLGWLRRWRNPAGAQSPGDGSAEFPDLAELPNQVLYGFGRLTLASRRLWPAGTSLFARLERLG
jgi:SAM-dependent methyltransferase